MWYCICYENARGLPLGARLCRSITWHNKRNTVIVRSLLSRARGVTTIFCNAIRSLMRRILFFIIKWYIFNSWNVYSKIFACTSYTFLNSEKKARGHIVKYFPFQFQALGQIIFTSMGLMQYYCVIDFLREVPMLVFIRILYFHSKYKLLLI